MFNLRKPTFAPLHRYGTTLFFFGVAIAFLVLSYGWSLGETNKMMALIVGAEWSMVASLLIQFGPQPSFILSGLTREQNYGSIFVFLLSISGLAMVLGIFFNLIDFLTNLGAFTTWYNSQSIDSTLTPGVVQGARIVGYVWCFIVTWAEELALLFFAAGVEHYRQVRLDLGKTAPKWMAWDIEGLARSAAGRGSSNQSPQASNGTNPRQRQRS